MAQRKANELGYVKTAQKIKRAPNRASPAPPVTAKDQINEGFGVNAAAQLLPSYFSFKCSRNERVREKGWAEGDADKPVCASCVNVARRNADEFQTRLVCYKCGSQRCREWRKGPVPGSMLCLPCWGLQFTCPLCPCTLSSFWYLLDRLDSTVRICDNCYRKRKRNYEPWKDRPCAGTCIYPGCTTTFAAWRWWNRRPDTGRVCARHNAFLIRVTDDHARLTKVLDKFVKAAPPNPTPNS